MTRHPSGHRIPILALALAIALITGGCDSVSTDSPNEPTIVHDHQISLDFTHRPTRESFGMEPDSNLRAYQRTGKAYDVSVTLPTGTFHTPAFLVEGSTDPAGGAHDQDHTHQPKYFDIQTTYPDGQEALQAVRDRAKVLGIAPRELTRLEDDLGSGATVPQSRVVNGLIRDWLSVSVAFADQEGSEVQVTYQIDIDTYHNPALDKVVHDGAMRLDLTTSPTRADLGFLPTYGDAAITPEPGDQLRLTLHGRDGDATVRAGSVHSTAGESGQPAYTAIESDGDPAQVRRELAGLQSVFDIPAARVRTFPTGEEALSWHGSTATCDVTVRASATPGRSDRFSASLKVLLEWK